MPLGTADFKADMSSWFKRQQLTHQQACVAIALNLAENIIRATPVDTGWARANWWPSLNKREDPPNTGKGSPHASTYDLGKKAGAKARAANGTASTGDGMTRAAAEFAGGKVGDLFILSNGVPYIRRLEHGWSKQAPKGMVLLSIQRLKTFFETFDPKAAP